MKRFFAIFGFVFLPVATLCARVDLLLVPPTHAVPGTPGVEFTLYLNNPTELDEIAHLPHELAASYASSARHGRVLLTLIDPRDMTRQVPAMTRQTIVLRLKDPIEGQGGFVSLRLTEPFSNAIMFELDPAAPLPHPAAEPPPEPIIARAPRSAIVPGRHIDLTTDIENMRRHISAYDPIYFAVGWRERLNARFQFSFKYRIFEPGPPGEPAWKRLARDVYVAYTQTSIWDLEAFSKPFYDSSYKPTVFLLHEFDSPPQSPWQVALQAGAQHESNGKGGGSAPVLTRPALISSTLGQRHPSDTRSLNTLYLAPRVRWSDSDNHFIEVGARMSAYFQIDENTDLARYRGYTELTMRGGYDRGLQVSAHARGRFSGHGSLELNATWPAIQTPLLKLILPPTLGGYAQVQYFNGYGESLLDYDVRRKDQLRFGMMIVR